MRSLESTVHFVSLLLAVLENQPRIAKRPVQQLALQGATLALANRCAFHFSVQLR